MLVPPACSGCKQPARQNTKKHRTSTLLVDDQMLSLRHACCDYNVQISTLGLSVTPAWHTHSSGWLLILRLHSQPYGTPQAPHAGTFVLSPHTSTAHLSCWPFLACCPPGGQGPLAGGQAPAVSNDRLHSQHQGSGTTNVVVHHNTNSWQRMTPAHGLPCLATCRNCLQGSRTPNAQCVNTPAQQACLEGGEQRQTIDKRCSTVLVTRNRRDAIAAACCS